MDWINTRKVLDGTMVGYSDIIRLTLQYLPSKKFILIATIIAVVASGVFFARIYKKNSDAVAVREEILDSTGEINNLKDSDNDGLKDWEEILWKTDQQNPDTDGDGVQDGEEIIKGRDPNVPGPNDTFPQGTKSEDSVFDSDITLTESIGITSIKQYLLGKLQTGTFDSQNFAKYMAENLKDITIGETDLYRHEDIVIIQRSDHDFLKKFAYKTAKITREAIQTDISFTQIDLSSNLSVETAKAFQPLIETYEKTEKMLLQQGVPASYALQYLQLINNFKKAKESLIAVKNIENDPVLALVGVLEFQEAFNNITYVMTAAQERLIADGVRLTPDDITQMFQISYNNEQ